MTTKQSTALLIGLFAILIIIALVLSRKGSIGSPLQQTVVPISPGTSNNPSSLPILANQRPDFVGIKNWWNTANNQPLTNEDLKGKVVLIDFWTYSCINCIRTQPVLKAWWKAYEKDGLVIVGVHTPEFAFEKDPKNVEDAIKRAGLLYPIALDADYGTWSAYENHYWPAEYLFDREGRLRYRHFGEGNYEESEQAIRKLLAEMKTLDQPATGADSSPKFDMIKTPETYFGYERTEHFANLPQLKKDAPQTYQLVDPKDYIWSIGGKWQINAESATGLESDATLKLASEANAVHMVLGSPNGTKRLRLLIDGADPLPDMLTPDTKRQASGQVVIEVQDKRLYHIARFPNALNHLIELRSLDSGTEFYAATFGE